MGLRPAKCYRWNSPAYTRVAKNPQDSFITGIPGSKITHYNTGNLKASFDTEVSIVSEGDIQVRNNALESARIAINQALENTLGANNYMLKVRVYPHHVIRENVMATGAGADRVQSGMRNAFGKPIGTAARVHKSQPVITVYINKSDERLTNAKKALRVGKMKLPGAMRISVKTHK